METIIKKINFVDNCRICYYNLINMNSRFCKEKKYLVPYGLISIRFLIAVLWIFISLLGISLEVYFFIGLLTIGLTTDILDGIIARYNDTSTIFLRRLDSLVDNIFWLSSTFYLYCHNSEIYKSHIYPFVTLLVMAGISYLYSFLNFKKELCMHSIMSKLWVLFLYITYILLSISANFSFMIIPCILAGGIVYIEKIVVIFFMKEWISDVPSVFHIMKYNRTGKLNRNKLFN
ncbi:CDP-alcohol phosphatidyltransferase family protein [Porphyromonas gingivalis]|uniref:CDP-alcohol phosphatidyltransferase family protein n=1 Tax=Porphyromonas gingivalis TaxID=837 RepID=UPI00097CDF17|nr:hypothetical protein CS550_01740 [Porphyromonas gingivalis]SJM19516.1 hypothetical protein PGIN_13-1_00848 [Porphyromonas gingivalis]